MPKGESVLATLHFLEQESMRLLSASAGLYSQGSKPVLDVEAELHHIAIGHDVILAFHAHFALGFCLCD